VIQGRNLIEMDAASLINEYTASSDPYAVVNVRGGDTRVKSQCKRTDFIRATLEPLWKTPLLFDLPSLEPSQLSGSTLDVEIFDHNDLTDPVPMGKVSLNLDEININPKLRGLGLTRSWYALRGTVTSSARGVVSSIADPKETSSEIEELDYGVPTGKLRSALGEIELMIDVVPDQIPQKPLAFNLGKLFRIIVPVVIYVLAFLIKTLAYAFVALFEGIAYYSITLAAWLYTGVTIKLGRVALRFGGFGTGCPTEIVVHDLKIPNPPGPSLFLATNNRCKVHFRFGHTRKLLMFLKQAHTLNIQIFLNCMSFASRSTLDQLWLQYSRKNETNLAFQY